MKNKNHWGGYYTGNKFEERFRSMLDARNIPHRKEKTLSYGKRRQKDKGADIEILFSPPILIELKSTTENTNLTFHLFDHSKKVNIKPHQIHNMDYLILEYRPHKPIVISKVEFILWACSVNKRSIMYKDALEIGFEMENLDWLEELCPWIPDARD